MLWLAASCQSRTLSMPLYSLDGHSPTLPADGRYWIAPGAQVIGKVVLHADASIWFNCVLRGDNETLEIGEGTNVQDNCTLHSDPGFPLTLGKGVTIGHNAIVHGCTVGDHALIGMGATVLNGAKIGAYSVVGANALVTEGKEFPDYALIVGSPAKVARIMTAEQAEALAGIAGKYVSNHKRYQKGLTLIAE